MLWPHISGRGGGSFNFGVFTCKQEVPGPIDGISILNADVKPCSDKTNNFLSYDFRTAVNRS